MSKIQVQYLTGVTVYAQVRNDSGEIWNGSSFETYSTANIANYDIPMAEQGTASGFYTVDFPAAISTGTQEYSVSAYFQAGGSPDENDVVIATGIIVKEEIEARLLPEGPRYIKVPAAGSVDYEFVITVHDYSGVPVNADGLPTVGAVNQDGDARGGNLGTVSSLGTGLYGVTYTVDSVHLEEQIQISWTVTVNSVARTISFDTWVGDDFRQDTDVLGVNVSQVDGSATAASKLKDLYEDAITLGTVTLQIDTSNFNTDLVKADNFYNNGSITFITGNLAGQTRRIETFLNLNGKITTATPLTVQPAVNDTFYIMGRIE